MTSDLPSIYCAFDLSDLDKALDLARAMNQTDCGIKLGLEFFNAFGPQGIAEIVKAAPNASLFIDLKYHDIPNTTAGAIRAMTNQFTPDYLNLHASGGLEMMKAARDACPAQTKLLAVTILTALDEGDLAQIGYQSGTSERVRNMALLAQKAGLDGVVCSALEIEMLREACGPNFVLMVPGIRPEGSDAQDQKRVMTPKRTIDSGATHLVIGRPITQSSDPAVAAQEILDSLSDDSES